VPDDQLALAIGKEGMNARLAARLTGWKIDIQSDTEFAQAEAAISFGGSGGEMEDVSGRCSAILTNGKRCPNAALPGSRFCGVAAHQALEGTGSDRVGGPQADEEEAEVVETVEVIENAEGEVVGIVDVVEAVEVVENAEGEVVGAVGIIETVEVVENAEGDIVEVVDVVEIVENAEGDVVEIVEAVEVIEPEAEEVPAVVATESEEEPESKA
jgi:N utilization substance protein A